MSLQAIHFSTEKRRRRYYGKSKRARDRICDKRAEYDQRFLGLCEKMHADSGDITQITKSHLIKLPHSQVRIFLGSGWGFLLFGLDFCNRAGFINDLGFDIFSSVAVPLYLLFLGKFPASCIVLAGTACIFWKHKENIVRLKCGKKIGLRRTSKGKDRIQ